MKPPAGVGVAGLGALGVTDAIAILVLWAGFGYAAWTDWRLREVEDHVWLVLAAAGLVLGLIRAWPASGASDTTVREVGLWILVGGLAIEHLVPWDERIGKFQEWLPGVLELIAYVAIGAVLVGVAWTYGTTTGTVAAIAGYAGIVLARALFEVRLLYGGADAKALIAASVLLPLWTTPWVVLPTSATSVLVVYPFALTLLMDGAVFAAAIPVALALRNLRAHEFEFPRGFTGYRLDVAELPDRFVWVRDPTFDSSADEAETSDDDRRVRERQRDELIAQGVTRVWVTPQLPFIILLAIGAVAAVVVGNIVFDLAALL
ncbi:MAG: hypothetical protein L3J73_04590 [Thermoplasmata archaeon]|nr:hypothetical protein [Thermoplasmata archaeon]